MNLKRALIVNLFLISTIIIKASEHVSSCTPTFSTDTITACEAYTWTNGVTYTASNNSAKDTFLNAAGCDSVVTLNLTIFKNSFDSTSIIACDSVVSPTGKIYTTTGTYLDTLTNSAGCDSIITSFVVIGDTTLPVVQTQDLTLFLDSLGLVSTSSLEVDSSSFDNCGISSMRLSDSLYDCTNVGQNTTWLIVTDRYGNVDSASALITVLDTIKPNALGQGRTVYLDSAGLATISPIDIDTGSYDVCGIYSILLSQSTFNCNNVGNNNIYLMVTDMTGNLDSASIEIVVLDTIKPTVLGQGRTVYLDSGGLASITTLDIDTGTTDQCGIDTMVLSQSTFFCSNLGVNAVDLIGTDVNGNIDSISVEVFVRDTINPSVIAQGSIVFLDSSGIVSILAENIDNGSTDNCGIATRMLSQSSFDCSHVGDNTIYLIISDLSGNVDSASVVVTVLDTIKPKVITQSTVVNLDANGSGSISSADIDNGSTDNCSISSRILSQTTFDCNHIGTNTVFMLVADPFGNTDSAVATVTVQDRVKPTIITKPVTIYLNSSGNADITPIDIDNGSSDNCGIARRILSKSSFDCSNVGANTIYLVITDVNGNIDSASAIVSVQDTIRPTILTTPDDVVLGYCDAAYSYNLPTGDDICGVTVTQIAGLASGATFPVGITVNTFEISDPSGNSVTTSFSVDIRDRYLPFTLSNLSLCNNSNKIDLSQGYDNIIFVGEGVESNAIFFNPASLDPDNYTITAEFTDSMGCLTTETFTIEIRTTPEVPTISRVASDQISVSGKYENYQWYRNGDELTNQTNPLLRVNELGIYSVVVGNGDNCAVASKAFRFGIPVNEENVTNQGLVKVFPNPTTDLVFVEIKDNIDEHKLSVADALGNQLIVQESTLKVVKLDLTPLTPGTYFLNISGGTTNETVVIIKK